MKLIILMSIVFSTLFATPAYQRLKEFHQNDGTTFYATPKGDEYLHYIETPEGDILRYNQDTKNYEYATIEGNRLVPSGKAYKKPTDENRATALQHQPNISVDALQALRERVLEEKRF